MKKSIRGGRRCLPSTVYNRTPLLIKEVLGQDIYDMCEKIRAEHVYQPYPIYMSYEMYEAFNKALEEDAKRFLKPINNKL